MKKVLYFTFVLITCHLTTSLHVQPQYEEPKKPVIPILKSSFEQSQHGYQFSYETGHGIQAQESGYIKNKGDEKHETFVQHGTVTYLDEHGNPITLTYIADENGFQPQGAHLPTPPPVPEELQRALHVQEAQLPQEYLTHYQ